jgi:hypothetical protein
MNEQVENIMRLASLLSTARCRRMAVHQPTYRGNETELSTTRRIEAATAELRAAVEALVGTKCVGATCEAVDV